MQSIQLLLIFLYFLINIYSKNWFRNSKIQEKFDQYVTVSIFYSSLDPESIEFFTKSFNGFYKGNVFDEHIVNLIPMSPGIEVGKKDKGMYEFKTVNGASESYANMLSTCTLHYLGRIHAYSYLICFEEKLKSNKVTYQNSESSVREVFNSCISDDSQLKILVKDCAENIVGSEAMYVNYGKMPKKMDHSPYILVDGVYDKEEEQKIKDDLYMYLQDMSIKLSKK